MFVNLVKSPTSTTSNAKLSIGSVVEKIKEDEIVQNQQDNMEMTGVDQNSWAIT
jgi:hypothetical protein